MKDIVSSQLFDMDEIAKALFAFDSMRSQKLIGNKTRMSCR